jgi:hypothetical protein
MVASLPKKWKLVAWFFLCAMRHSLYTTMCWSTQWLSIVKDTQKGPLRQKYIIKLHKVLLVFGGQLVMWELNLVTVNCEAVFFFFFFYTALKGFVDFLMLMLCVYPFLVHGQYSFVVISTKGKFKCLSIIKYFCPLPPSHSPEVWISFSVLLRIFYITDMQCISCGSRVMSV